MNLDLTKRDIENQRFDSKMVQALQIFIWLKHATLGYGTEFQTLTSCFVEIMLKTLSLLRPIVSHESHVTPYHWYHQRLGTLIICHMWV